MSSSRSIAAARARRTNEPAQPVNGNRPITSIGSQAAFSQMPPPPNNIRIARGPPPQQQMYQQPPPQQQMYQHPPHQQQMYQQPPPPPPQQQMYQQQQQAPNPLPFTKLSISDAIGLITLRLGRVEQYIIELDHSDEQMTANVPNNVQMVDNSIFNNIASRLDAIEKREPVSAGASSEQLAQINEEITTLRDHIQKLNDELVKTNLSAAKHSEQMLRFERDFVENKDILKTLLIKFDLFVKETSDKFVDYENAIVELEKNFPQDDDENNETSSNNENENGENIEAENSTSIMTIDLKNIIKQELANEDI